jgi:hypothetical protein|tara:strand:- start:1086 stop:1313 length:228 start_codon:yes stop_codon:yes gene_type:complete
MKNIPEEACADKDAVASKLLEFLSLDHIDLLENALEAHSNVATLPRNIQLQAFKNLMLRAFSKRHYEGGLPFLQK